MCPDIANLDRIKLAISGSSSQIPGPGKICIISSYKMQQRGTEWHEGVSWPVEGALIILKCHLRDSSWVAHTLAQHKPTFLYNFSHLAQTQTEAICISCGQVGMKKARSLWQGKTRKRQKQQQSGPALLSLEIALYSLGLGDVVFWGHHA